MNLENHILRTFNKIHRVLFLGTGTSEIILPLNILKTISFLEANLPDINIQGHNGLIEFAQSEEGVNYIIFRGRWHFYEGHTPEPYIHILEVINKLSNPEEISIYLFFAAGALGYEVTTSSIFYISQIFNGFENPSLTCINYSPEDLDHFSNLNIRKASYVTGVVGPTYGTPSESLFMRQLGYTHVGMSFTIESNVFSNFRGRIYPFLVTTDIASGLVNELGEQTLYHSHEIVLNNFRSNQHFIRDLLITLLFKFQYLK